MKLKFDIEQLGKDLIKERGDKSHGVISKEMGLPHATLFRIENGHQLDLNVSTLVKICNWTGIRPEIYFKLERK